MGYVRPQQRLGKAAWPIPARLAAEWGLGLVVILDLGEADLVRGELIPLFPGGLCCGDAAFEIIHGRLAVVFITTPGDGESQYWASASSAPIQFGPQLTMMRCCRSVGGTFFEAREQLLQFAGAGNDNSHLDGPEIKEQAEIVRIRPVNTAAMVRRLGGSPFAEAASSRGAARPAG